MGKVLSIFLLLLFLSFPLIAQETVVLNTPYDKEISIDIPKDKKEMKDLIIEVAELYWGERYDLEKKLEDEKKLLKKIEELKERLKESNQTIENLKVELKKTQDLLEEKVKPTPFKWGININGGAMFYDSNTLLTFRGQPYILLFEAVSIGVDLGYPLQISLSFGIQF
jgi:hypothetical protein